MDPKLAQVLETVSKDMLGYVNFALGDSNSLGSLRRHLYVIDKDSDSSATTYLKRTKLMYFQ
jgi:hypothetical protein